MANLSLIIDIKEFNQKEMCMSTNLSEIAKNLLADGKGILAADESGGTIGKRFADIGVENNEDNRRKWRQIMFETPNLEHYISGVILFDETIRQSSADGMPFVDILQSNGIIPGIKVDKSTTPLANSAGELVTQGLDGLRERFEEYYAMGARFAKWRAVITIGADIPSQYCIDVNAHLLGRYASLAQSCGIVPIVEPEVLMDGTHSIDRCDEVTRHTLQAVFAELYAQRVDLTGIVLKPNMVLSGKDAKNRASTDEVAERTLDCLLATVPPAVPGIAFLSGGQGDEEATINLSAMNRIASSKNAPWKLTYSYGRGLQADPLATWSGANSQVQATQSKLMARSKDCSLASLGQYA